VQSRIAFWVGSISVALTLILGGCQTQNPADQANPQAKKSTSESGDRIQVAVIPKGSTHEFWKAVKAGAEEGGQVANAEIIWKGPLQESDREEQIRIVEDFTTRGVDAIVLAPLDESALKASVQNAVAQGIHVIIIDSALKDSPDLPFVATDNFKGGQMAGEEMRRLLTGGGNVIMLRYQEGSASTAEREAGFLQAIQAEPSIKVLSSNQYGGATKETAQAAAENLLSRFPQVDAIYCPNESSTAGMLRALQSAGLAGKVKFVGFDSSPQLLEGLSKGEIHALILQNPFNMGKLGVEAAVNKKKGEPVEARIDTGATLVTQANRNEPDIAKLLAPSKE
jgi:ribose transport system substrate-binding protein